MNLALIWAAAAARLSVLWPDARVYKPGEVPQLPPTPYVVLSVDSGVPENHDRAGQHGTLRLTLVVQLVAQTLDRMHALVGYADAAWLDHMLVVPGVATTPATRQPSTVRRDDDAGGLLYALALYTFTAVQEDT